MVRPVPPWPNSALLMHCTVKALRKHLSVPYLNPLKPLSGSSRDFLGHTEGEEPGCACPASGVFQRDSDLNSPALPRNSRQPKREWLMCWSSSRRFRTVDTSS